MIRSDIRTRLLAAVNDPGGVFLTTTEANTLIDEALEVLAEEVEAERRTAYVALQPGVIYYHIGALAADLMAPFRIWLVHDHRRLNAVTMRELDQREVLWQQTTGQPTCWFPMSWDWFGVWPKSSTGGNIMQVDYWAWPPALLDDDDEPQLLDQDLDILVAYGMYDVIAKRWDAKGTVEAWAAFMQQAGITRGRTNVRPGSEAFQRSSGIGFYSGVRG